MREACFQSACDLILLGAGRGALPPGQEVDFRDSFRDKVVIVTGASSGIGRATALALAERGAIVVGVARRESLLRELADQCRVHSPGSTWFAGDLGSRTFAEGVVTRTVEQLGRLDVLINNAAVPVRKELFRISVDDAEEAMRIDFSSCLWTSFSAIPAMLAQGGGTIVNVSSFASKVVPTHETIYAAAKCAMNGFTEGLWNDLAGSGIHAVLVHPGPIDTEIWEKGEAGPGYSGRKHPPQVVADAIVAAIEKRRYEVVVPARSLPLVAARFLRLVFPALLRFGMKRMDGVSEQSVRVARERARAGHRMGELGLPERESGDSGPPRR